MNENEIETTDEDEDEFEFDLEIENENLIRHEEDYKKETARLLQMIDRRKELVGLFKIAKPQRFAELREAISSLDKSIESTEKIIEMTEDLIQKRRNYIESLRETFIMSEKIVKGAREHFADQPEKLEQLEALLEDTGISH